MLTTIVIVIDVIAALFLILTILLHSGRGAASDMFGGTSSLSGGTAMERTLDRLTVITALIFGSAPSTWPGSGTRRGSRPTRLVDSGSSTSEWRNLVDALG